MTLGVSLRRLGSWLIEFGDRVEGVEIVGSWPINLEPEHALAALREAEARLGRDSGPGEERDA